MAKADVGSIGAPTISIGDGKIIVTGRMIERYQVMPPTEAMSLHGLSWSSRHQSHVVLEAPVQIEHGTKLESLFDKQDRIDFTVLKARDGINLRPFQALDPYTDDWKVTLCYDDFMTILLSV